MDGLGRVLTMRLPSPYHMPSQTVPGPSYVKANN